MNDQGAVAGGGAPGGSRAPESETILVEARDALIAVDVQRDFCPGGSLGVLEGDEVIPVIDRLVPLFSHWVYTRDWHPPGHVSFSAHPEFHDLSWPAHAVQGTPGAEWCPDLVVPAEALMVSKGDDPLRETYSGFQVEGFSLADFLREKGVERVFVTGLATDYCVRQTALDALGAGFVVFLVEDGVRGVAPDTTARTLAGLEAAGVRRVWSGQLAPALSGENAGSGSGRPHGRASGASTSQGDQAGSRAGNQAGSRAGSRAGSPRRGERGSEV